MANWKRLNYDDARELFGISILLSERNAQTNNAVNIAGILVADADGSLFIRDYNGGKWKLLPDYRYYYIRIDEIMF